MPFRTPSLFRFINILLTIHHSAVVPCGRESGHGPWASSVPIVRVGLFSADGWYLGAGLCDLAAAGLLEEDRRLGRERDERLRCRIAIADPVTMSPSFGRPVSSPSTRPSTPRYQRTSGSGRQVWRHEWPLGSAASVAPISRRLGACCRTSTSSSEGVAGAGRHGQGRAHGLGKGRSSSVLRPSGDHEVADPARQHFRDYAEVILRFDTLVPAAVVRDLQEEGFPARM